MRIPVTRLLLSLAACFLAFLAAAPVAPAATIYRDTTGSREILIHAQEEPFSQGLLFRSKLSDGDFYEVEYGPLDTTVRFLVQSMARKLDYTVIREGNLLRYAGVMGGKPLARTQKIDGNPWFETIEISFRGFSRSARTTPSIFWVVQPWEAKAYLMQAVNEGEETISVGTTQIKAMRVRVNPSGLLARFWSALYWFRSSDGLYVRYEAVRGLPGTPPTVVQLASESSERLAVDD
jgi:hypothetical protein